MNQRIHNVTTSAMGVVRAFIFTVYITTLHIPYSVTQHTDSTKAFFIGLCHTVSRYSDTHKEGTAFCEPISAKFIHFQLDYMQIYYTQSK